MAKPTHISSNWTLFLKVFFPIFWGVFFGAITLAFWLSAEAYIGGMKMSYFRLLMTSFFLTGLLVFYLSTMQLKRVEVDDNFVYITNYKKTARYPFHNIQKVEITDYYLFKIGKVLFRTPGIFGSKISFLANSFRLRNVLNQNHQLANVYHQETQK